MNDKKTLDRIVTDFFNSFKSSDLVKTDLNQIVPLFLSQAIIIKTCTVPAIYTLTEFILPRQKILTDGSLLKFSEYEIAEETKIFGEIAQRILVYEKTGLLNGKTFTERGVKTIQFVKINQQWKISSLSWDDERDSLKIAADFLKR